MYQTLPNKGNKHKTKRSGKRSGKRTSKSPENSSLVGGFKTGPATSLTRISEGWMPIFPPRTKRVLRYSTNISLVSAAGVVATYIFRANDLFDPDFTSTGHQPMGFDQMMSFYNHFSVERSKILVTFKNQATGTMRCCVRIDADNVGITVPDQILEFGGLTTDTLEAKGVYGANKSMTLVVDIPRIQGISRSSLTSDPTLRGSASSSPTEITYFHVQIWDPLGGGGTVGADILLEQAAWFLEPRDLTESFSERKVAGCTRVARSAGATRIGRV